MEPSSEQPVRPVEADQSEAAFPHPAETSGSVPQDSEAFRNLPNDAAPFRTVPQASETFRKFTQPAEAGQTTAQARGEDHTLTVREAARRFEAAGVARTERSIVNWCQINAQGISRLDAYYDPNDRRYYITPQSVERAVAEEKAKAVRGSDLRPPVPQGSAAGNGRSDADAKPRPARPEADDELTAELRKELLDLKITNRAKDLFIEQLKQERESFAAERQEYVEKLMTFNRRLGELETRLVLPNPPRTEPGHQE
jgi:hypothetical protein